EVFQLASATSSMMSQCTPCSPLNRLAVPYQLHSASSFTFAESRNNGICVCSPRFTSTVPKRPYHSQAVRMFRFYFAKVSEAISTQQHRNGIVCHTVQQHHVP